MYKPRARVRYKKKKKDKLEKIRMKEGYQNMCYKEEVQKRNEEKLQRKFEVDNVPGFIQTYFINIESKIGAINYWIAIKDLLLWLMERNIINKTLLSDITPDDFYEVESEDVTLYLKTKEQNGLSPTTLETRKNIFSSFWKYLKRTKKCPVNENIIESVSYKGISYSNNIVRKLPSEEQLKMMEDKIMNKKEDFVRIRNLIILRVLKGTGLRESELAGLDVSDLYLDDEMPYIKIIGKGKYRAREARNVYLPGDAAKAIKEGLMYRDEIDNIIDNSAVFLNKNGKRLTEDNIKSMFKTYGNGVTPHMIRHWYATIMANTGNIAFAQQQLGHTSQNITINNYANGAYGMKDILVNIQFYTKSDNDCKKCKNMLK